MNLSKPSIARIGRAIIAAFAAQVVAAAMCVMPVNAMAGGMAMHDDACIMHHVTQSHAKHACPHCDAPAQAVSQIDIGHELQAPTPVLVAVLSMPQQAVPARQSPVPVERILAPPDSASLIYSTNLRIRI
jgi:hypothetical protein